MEQLLAYIDWWQGSSVGYWVATGNGALWAFLYFRLRQRVKANEELKGALIDEALETANNNGLAKFKKIHAMGMAHALSKFPNLIIKR